ncbi:MAG: copper transporter, partial [Candidatus Nanopelagicales bacterium]
FRYHIVSIVAIFLALAVGIVLGSGPLNDDISGFLEDRTNALASDKVELQTAVSRLTSDVESSQRYAQLVQPAVLDGLLVTQPVVVVVLPDASGEAVKEVQTAIDQAGGRMTERVDIDKSWTDPDKMASLGAVADALPHAGDSSGDAYEVAGQVLAGALVTNDISSAGQPDRASTVVLGTYERAGFIKADQEEVVRGGSVIVIGSSDVNEAASATLVPLISALDADGEGTVVSGPLESAEPGGIVGSVRNGDLDELVSTVDRVDTPEGVSVTVLALVDQRQGEVGHYGTGSGAQGPAPDPIPGT